MIVWPWSIFSSISFPRAATTVAVLRERVEIAIKLAKQLGLAKPDRYGLVDVVRRSCKCYAGLQETMRAGPMVMPTNLTCSTALFQAEWQRLHNGNQHPFKNRPPNPGIHNAPRMIFISDMAMPCPAMFPSNI